MSEPPRRKRFQIHLSTAVVMMFVAGTLIWANLISRSGFVIEADGSEVYHAYGHGWPWRAFFWDFLLDSQSPPSLFSITDFALNIITGVLILFAAWIVCEWFIRRRARRMNVAPMPERSRRHRIQVHLSTAVAMMFASAGLLWINLQGTDTSLTSFQIFPGAHYSNPAARLFGWPFNAVTRIQLSERGLLMGKFAYYPKYEIVFLNTLIALGIILATWFICEWLIRRRAARKGA